MFNNLRLFMTMSHVCFYSTNLLQRRKWASKELHIDFAFLKAKATHVGKEASLASLTVTVQTGFTRCKKDDC